MSEDLTGRTGIVFNIQRYSIHDGPGIRTTVFLKGCPLRCKWCANPESMTPNPEIFFREEQCDLCGKCLDTCVLNAIIKGENSVKIDRSKCNNCMKCLEVCHDGIITSMGKSITVEEVVEEVLRDELFYNNSGGGVTLSGGEPLYQAKFTLNILKGCKDNSLHTALDTTGYAKWEKLDKILNFTDLVLYDIKHLDDNIHQKGTGVSNELILHNFEKIIKKGTKIWVRVPVIPNFNYFSQYLEDLANFLSQKPIEKVSLLKYHEWGKHKYKYLNIKYPLDNIKPINDEEMEELKKIMESYGLNVTLDY